MYSRFYVFDVKFLLYSIAQVWQIWTDGTGGRTSGRERRQGFFVRGSEGEGSNPTIYKFFTHHFWINHLKIVHRLLELKFMSGVSVFKSGARKNLVKRKFRALIIFSSCTDSSCNTVENKTLLRCVRKEVKWAEFIAKMCSLWGRLAWLRRG